MSVYVPMICGSCRRRQERWSNSRFCSCGGRLALCEKARPRKAASFTVATGQVIANERRRLGMTAATLARRANLSKSFISDVENGKRGVSLEHWYDLTMALSGRYTGLLDEVVGLLRKD